MDTLKLKLLKYSSVFVVYDRNVEEYALKTAGRKPSFALDISEQTKTIDTVMRIERWLLEQGADRKSLVLAIGGGVTTDIVGFAASIYKRGIRFANVPTTLLAQVDAAIGGKTGINMDSYKNMLGTFRQPEFVHIDTDLLRTLPQNQFLSGAAEMLKTFIIADRTSYDRALQILSSKEINSDLEKLIKKAGKIKSKIVRKDPEEDGRRRVLNLGHTYAHAIEWWQQANHKQDPCTHGEAVAIGIVQAARKSEEEGIAKPGLCDKIRSDFRYCGLPTELPCLEEELEQAIRKDKKTEGGRLNFVFIRDIGSVVVKKI